MRPFYWVILLVVQLWIACQLTFAPFDVFRVAYRRDERAAALRAQRENPSPATRAAVQEELRRAVAHVQATQFATAGVIFAALVALDVLCFYGWKHVKREPASP